MRKLFLGAVGVAALSFSSIASAVLLPGTSGQPITSGLPTPGTLLATLTVPVSNSGAGTNLSVSMTTAVYRDATGFLDFAYQVTNLGTSNTSIEELTFGNFTSFTITDVNQQLAAWGIFGAGSQLAATAGRRPAGDVLSIAFDQSTVPSLLNPGETSAIFMFQTDANFFTSGTFTAQDGLTVSAAAFAPVRPVPEPATWAMMLLGFGGLGFTMRRRHKAHRAQIA